MSGLLLALLAAATPQTDLVTPPIPRPIPRGVGIAVAQATIIDVRRIPIGRPPGKRRLAPARPSAAELVEFE